MGLERQGRQLAGREGAAWLEFWPWLGEYADLTTDQGLDLLENYLEEKIREAREVQDRDNQEELEDELEASLLLTGCRGREAERLRPAANAQNATISSRSLRFGPSLRHAA